jgi:hypothetical protein
MHKVLRKLNERALYVKKSKASLKQRNQIPWLYYSIWANQEELKKDKRSQELAFAKTSQESTSLSEIDELLSKFVPNYAKIAEPSHN